MTISWCMMDPKEDRSLSTSAQPVSTDLRIVERKPGGVVVSGTKLHTTMGPGTHHVVVVPCRALGKADRDFALSFTLPIDTEGIKMIARASPGPVRDVAMESPPQLPLPGRFAGHRHYFGIYGQRRRFARHQRSGHEASVRSG